MQQSQCLRNKPNFFKPNLTQFVDYLLLVDNGISPGKRLKLTVRTASR
jgi:hypothetical protein